ncbi:unnamed protein product [Dracunculus medinensis]|uniref:Uncharacterized protein n=1 Tax=Dracunculus medinensis TaxID=318479 RepID=A0A3P7PHC8_DRAME|nr:unnamed protein product [Dracunculus medinensis]
MRLASAIYALMNSPSDSNTPAELLMKTKLFLQTMEISSLSHFLPNQDIQTLRRIISDLRYQQSYNGKCMIVSSFFIIMLKKIIEEVLVLFAKIISLYLLNSTNCDRLLVIALEQLIHLMLFGDEICLAILSLCDISSTPNETLRLLLRALSILCGLYKASLRLIFLGGLETIINIMFTAPIPCAVEAAGVFAQLTNPNHNFITFNSSLFITVETICYCHSNCFQLIKFKNYNRNLEIIDESLTSESLLLSMVALANITSQKKPVVDSLYRHNGIKRIVNALQRPDCKTVFVLEQVIIFSLAYAIIAQNAIPLLLSALTETDAVYSHYCQQIQHKAAICINALASKGIGLKALYEKNGYMVISKLLRMECIQRTSVAVICSNIKVMMEKKYQLESAV